MRRHTADQIPDFHRALYHACGLPAIRMSIGDQRSWWDFLLEMEPLCDDESGAFCVDDIPPVIRLMDRERREGKAGWSLRPSQILRNPETFRDLVLLTRAERRKHRAKSADVLKPSYQPPTAEKNSPDSYQSKEDAYASFSRLKEKLLGGEA